MPSADELSPRGEKREAEEEEEESSEDDMVGPSIQDAAPLKKKRVLEYEKVYLGNLFNLSFKMNLGLGLIKTFLGERCG